ncbi:MAG: hypothetical protein ABIQ30_09775 [Devosia sp.]
MLNLDNGSATVEVPIDISAPEYRDGAWICDFAIGWPGEPDRSHAAGADSVQALYLALQKIAVCLYSSEYHQSGRLYLERPGYGYGFPLPLGSRANAVGGDKKL